MAKPRILIEITGGCLSAVTTDGDVEVFLLDHDNHDDTPRAYAVDATLDREAFTARLNAFAS